MEIINIFYVELDVVVTSFRVQQFYHKIFLCAAY